MQIFISHSSKNENYGNALVDFLIGVGVSPEQIIYTSNDAYGIPIGENIFNWLKSKITEKPYVLYLLSSDYYTSVACLNEMGAAWIVENEHTMIFTPNFNLNSYEFQNGALDPREIGFYINNQDRLTGFIESLKKSFSISKNPVLINQKVREFILRIEKFEKKDIGSISNKIVEEPTVVSVDNENKKSLETKSTNTTPVKISNGTTRFFNDLMSNKLKDEEIILIHYIKETAKYKLGIGWQTSNEIDDIKEWEDINELNSTLSSNYESLIRRLGMKNLTEVSEITSYGNPKEVCMLPAFQEKLLDISENELNKIMQVVKKNMKEEEEWNF